MPAKAGMTPQRSNESKRVVWISGRMRKDKNHAGLSTLQLICQARAAAVMIIVATGDAPPITDIPKTTTPPTGTLSIV
jgi:hypothetical protein